MNHLTIHGTSTTLTRRQPQPALRQPRSNVRLNASSTNASASRTGTNMNNQPLEKAPAAKISSQRPMTLIRLEKLLGEWIDPEPNAELDQAKEKITHCFKQRSDKLDLSFLCLSTLPDVFDGMQHIHYLSIANNFFSEIPRFLNKLTSLKLLNVSNNVLIEIPDFIKEFKSLDWLNAESNQLQKVSDELSRLPKLQTLMLAHNRIMNLPQNIHRIKSRTIEDQIPLASFGDFSPEFSTRWEETFQNESYSGYFEIWLARYEEMLRSQEAKNYRSVFKQRIGELLRAMTNDSDFRKICFEKARDVVATSYNGILFSLYELETKYVERRIMKLELSDVEVRQEVERAFNFYYLQEFAHLHAQHISLNNNATAEEEVVDGQEAVLFFYTSPDNTMEMPMGYEIPRFMFVPSSGIATHDDVRKAVERIRQEKYELGPDYLMNFILDKEYWIDYLLQRYADFITEHTQVFFDQIDKLEETRSQINEYDYLTQMNAIYAEKNKSETRLHRELTRNIIMDS